MIRKRVRIRFRKEGDLRFASHRDLMRTWERLLRRAGLRLSMSEGFHPKPRMSLVSALAVGIAGTDEVIDVELAEEREASDVQAALAAQAPPGLAIELVELLPEKAATAQVGSVTFEVPVPQERQAALAQRIRTLLAETSHPIQRTTRAAPLDLRPLLDEVALVDGVLTMRLRVNREGSARPREILEALEVADLEEQGQMLTRTRVELLP